VKTESSPLGSYPHTANRTPKGPHDPAVKPLEQKPKIPESTPDYKVELSSKVSTPSPSAPKIETPKLEEVAKGQVKEEVKTQALKAAEVRAGTLKKPALIFVKGLDIFSSPSKSERGYAGVGRIAEAVEGARIYGWDQKQEIIDEIKKVHSDYQVVLVGHSLGGDTAVEIANELNSLDNKFRSVDLLVTIDSVGFNNDIIPQNVKKHLNIFGERDFFFNDGPNVARDHNRTEVTNILSPFDHTEIDDDKSVQFEIVSLIQKTINRSV